MEYWLLRELIEISHWMIVLMPKFQLRMESFAWIPEIMKLFNDYPLNLILQRMDDLEKNQEKLQKDLRDSVEKLKDKINWIWILYH